MREKRRYWTPSEIAYLKANYGEKTAAEIAVTLKRTRSAVHGLRRKLGLHMTWEQCGKAHSPGAKRAAQSRLGRNSSLWKHGQTKERFKPQVKYMERNPEKRRAHRAVYHAKRVGKLEQLPCKVCGSPKSESHHESYSKPLDVIWLCRKHHKEADRARRDREQSTTPSN